NSGRLEVKPSPELWHDDGNITRTFPHRTGMSVARLGDLSAEARTARRKRHPPRGATRPSPSIRYPTGKTVHAALRDCGSSEGSQHRSGDRKTRARKIEFR